MEIAIGIAGLTLTAIGGAYKLWVSRRRPKFEMKFDWMERGSQAELRFYVLNNGHARGIVRELRFGTDDTPSSEGWLKQNAVLSKLPLTLEPHSSTQAFSLEVNPLDPREFDQRLARGEITKCFLENGRRKIHVFKVPSRWPAKASP